MSSTTTVDIPLIALVFSILGTVGGLVFQGINTFKNWCREKTAKKKGKNNNNGRSGYIS